MDNITKEFYVEVSSDLQIENFNRSSVLNMLDLAEKAGADKFYICVRKNIEKHNALVKKFSFIGFRKLSQDK